MPEYSVVPSPSYPSPNYQAFGDMIGNLPNVYRQSQEQQQQLDQQNAFKSGLPTDANGAPDYSAIMRVLASKGDINAIGQLGPMAQQQQQMRQAGQISPMLGGSPGASTPQPTGDLPPASAGAAIPTVPRVAASSPAPTVDQADSSGQSVSSLVSTALPDSSKAATIAGNIAKSLGIDPNAPLPPDKAAYVARAMDGYLQRTGTTKGAVSATLSADPQTRFPDTQAGHEAYIRQKAAQLGIDPDFAVRVANAEGLGALSAKNPNAASSVDRNPDGTPFSFGDFQLNVRNGLGNAARAQGINPADPNQWQKADDFALSYMDKNGLQPWKGDAAVEALRSVRTPSAASPSANRPIVPQVPLPEGFTDPQQAILAMDREMARLSTNPYASGQITALQDWRDRIAASVKPMEVGPYSSYVDPATGQTLYKGALAQNGAGLTPDAIEGAAETYLKTGKPPTNLGRGAQGAQNLAAIINRAYQIAEQRGIDPSKIAENQQAFNARPAGLRQVFQRATGLTLVENEANRLIPRVRDLLPKLDHTRFPTLNAAINAYEKQTGDPNIVKFGISADSLASVYARVLKGGGTPTGGETDRAHELLNKAWSSGQINAALDQMGIELQSAKQSTDDTLKEFGLGMSDMPGSGPFSAVSSSPPGGGQAPTPNSGGATLAPGRYVWDPATGNLVPAK